jgi:Helix-turn-helix of DDE superfamily endonuclease
MSILSDHIDKYPEDVKRLLGIDDSSLQQLIDQAELAYEKIKADSEQSKIRIIAAGGGRKYTLSSRDQILLTLTYLRQHPTFQWLGLNFGVSESTAHNIFHSWIKILSSILPPSLLEEFPDEDDSSEILDALSEFVFIIMGRLFVSCVD